jgi:hypothetical protein
MTRRQRGDLEMVILIICIFIACSVSLRGEDLHNDVPGTPVVEASR